jgi:hypothetical protein
MDCWNDDSNIFGCVGWLCGNWNRFVPPMAPGVANEAEIAMKPIAVEVSLCTGTRKSTGGTRGEVSSLGKKLA